MGFLNKIITSSFKAINLKEGNSIDISDCIFTNSQSDSASAIYLVKSNSIFVKASRFVNNSVTFFGGVMISYGANNVIINCSFFAFNTALDGHSGVLYFDSDHKNVFLGLSVFFGSNAANRGGVVYVGSNNKNISFESNLVFVSYAFEGAVFYFLTANSNSKITNCTFFYVYCLEGGVLMYFSRFNSEIYILDCLLFKSGSYKALSNIYMNQNNTIKIERVTLVYSSVSELNSHIQFNNKNSLKLKQLIVIDLFKRGIIYVQSDENEVMLDNNTYHFANNLPSALQGFESILIISKLNVITINNTKFEGLNLNSGLIAVKESNNTIIINNSSLSMVRATYFLSATSNLNNNLTTIIHLFNFSVYHSSFKQYFLKANSSKIMISNGRFNFNPYSSPFFITINATKIFIKHSIIKLRSDNYSVFPLSNESQVIISLGSLVSIFKSQFFSAIPSRTFSKSLLSLTKSNSSISYSDFFLFDIGNKANLFMLLGSNTSVLIIEYSSFIRITGQMGVGLVRESNFSLINNSFILNGGRGLEMRSDVFSIFLTPLTNIIVKNNVFLQPLLTRSSAVTMKHNNLLSKSFIEDFIGSNHFVDKNQLGNKLLSSLATSFFLMHNFSHDTSISHFNQSYKLIDVPNKIIKDNCYTNIIGLDNYNNVQPLVSSLEMGSIFNYVSEQSSVLLVFKVLEYSFCLINATNMNVNELKRSPVIEILISKLPLDFSYISQEAMRLNLSLEVGFRTCRSGELYDSTENICKPCEIGFHLELGKIDFCERCKEQDHFNCYGADLLTPKPGYARYSTYSYIFLPCPNKNSCIGDPYFSMGAEYQKVAFWTGKVGIGTCLKGYEGILCSACEQNFGISDNYTCLNCSSEIYILGLLFKILFRLIILYASISTALSVNHSFELKRSMETYIAKMNFFLKSLINHFQVLMMMNALQFSLPQSIKQLFSIFISASAPDLGNTFSFECFLRRFNINIPYHYFRIISIFFFNMLTFLVFLLFEYLRVTKMSVNLQTRLSLKFFFKKYATNLLLLILTITFIDQIKPALELLACVEVGDPAKHIHSLRLIAQLSIDCSDSSHIRWTLAIGLPVLILIGLMFPSFLMSRLHKKKKDKVLYSKDVVSKYGCLYYGYKPDKYYYELIVLFRKFCFLIVQVFFFTYPGNSKIFSFVNASLLLLLVTTLFYLVQIFLDPYNKEFFQSVHRCDSLSFIVLMITIYLGIFWITRGEDLTNEEAMILFSIAIVVNALFFTFWAWHFLSFITIDVRRFFNSFKFRTSPQVNYKKKYTSKKSRSQERSSVFAISGTNTEFPIKIILDDKKSIKDLKNFLTVKPKGIIDIESKKEINESKAENSSTEQSEYLRLCLEKIKELELLVQSQKKEIATLKLELNKKQIKLINPELASGFFLGNFPRKLSKDELSPANEEQGELIFHKREGLHEKTSGGESIINSNESPALGYSLLSENIISLSDEIYHKYVLEVNKSIKEVYMNPEKNKNYSQFNQAHQVYLIENNKSTGKSLLAIVINKQKQHMISSKITLTLTNADSGYKEDLNISLGVEHSLRDPDKHLLLEGAPEQN